MADVAVSEREVSSYGNRRISTGRFTMSTSADFTVQTGLSRVDNFKVVDLDAQDGGDGIYYLNSNTTSDNVPGYGGWVYVDADGATAWNDGEEYMFEAVGY